MIAGLGTDVVELHRVSQSLEKFGETFAKRVLSPAELSKWQTMSDHRKVEFVAGRFAAKEAIAKAAGCGLGALHMKLVDLHLGERGLEVSFLHTTALPSGCDGTWSISISHSETVAFAVAVVERSR